MTQIDFFFQEPTNLLEHQVSFSTLYLLRRDIRTCFGYNPNDNSRINYQALFPGAMATMAGIDLLSKFLCTDNNVPGNKSGDRFKKYVVNYIDETNQEILYQLRNSLLHSFGLYSKDNQGKEYNFILNNNSKEFISFLDNKNYYISIVKLMEKFENSIHEYKLDLSKDISLQNNFNEMILKYGQIGMAK